MAPDRAELVPADALPDLPPALDVGALVQRFAGAGHYALGQWRCLAMDLAAHPQQYAETDREQRRERDP
jgi:hypothetical protein